MAKEFKMSQARYDELKAAHYLESVYMQKQQF